MNIYSRNTTDYGPQSGMEIIAEWVEALHGHGTVEGAIGDISEFISAEAALLVRNVDNNVRVIASHDPNSQDLLYQKRRSYAFDLFSGYLLHSKMGAVITLNEAARDNLLGREEIADFHKGAAITEVRDVAVVCLSNCPESLDMLEFHFKSEMSSSNISFLTSLASTLANSWSSRLPGTANKNSVRLHSKNNRTRNLSENVPILHQSNPRNLSRCEFRVCTLVKEGMVAKSIAAQLNVSESTVRSHLRSIYMKTENSCHVELLHCLTAGGSGERNQSAEIAEKHSSLAGRENIPFVSEVVLEKRHA